ncbi:MAG TPA: bifunctional (p)ppGpp synthetase/guanosine-3',5'-bis(diphosphate) 3'-pyrophosphohydrolase, partial [Firmicutes bacterium]|nr:bifunctional (p)ppGpp synthetase/guanosine-3',5'-bis(diphosphate) 3'-pyrophosphohydrolase [Bacillota bacterium]
MTDPEPVRGGATLTVGRGERNVTVEEILRRMRTYWPRLDEDLLRRADRFIEQAHGDQLRLSGYPYISHPRNVALILTELEMDPASVAAGLLHDVLEDTEVTEKDLRKEFGEEITSLVQGVTKLGRIDLATTQEEQMENLRRMLLATAKDLRVVLIKFCDRLHNMRT